MQAGRTPLPVLDRADSGPMTAFSSFCSIGAITRSAPPRSSRRNAPRGPNSARSRNLRFRGASCCPSAPEVGVAASPPMALPLRASAAARDTRPSGTRRRAPADHVSRPSRRGPPRQRHADWGFPAEDPSWGTANPKFHLGGGRHVCRPYSDTASWARAACMPPVQRFGTSWVGAAYMPPPRALR